MGRRYRRPFLLKGKKHSVMRRYSLFVLLSGILLAVSIERAEAQTSFALGGHFGYDVEFENTFIGGQARIGGNGFPLVFQPGVEIGLDDTDYTWVEGNLLYMVGEGHTFAFTPYVGAGVSVEFFEDFGDTRSEFGFNVLAGIELGGFSSNIVPFAQVRYTVADGPDPAAIMGGILFRFGSY